MTRRFLLTSRTLSRTTSRTTSRTAGPLTSPVRGPVTVLVAVLACLAGAACVAPPALAQAPTVTVTSAVDPGYPQQVPATGDPSVYTDVPIWFRLDSDAALSGATATASGSGLTFSPATVALGPKAAGAPQLFDFDVTADTPGLHAMTVTVTADGASTTITLPSIWSAGGPALAGDGDLTGRSYGWQGTRSGGESDVRAVAMLTFVSPTFAYRGLPPHGRPTCHHTTKKCQRYHYDTTTGLVQVGDDVIGTVIGRRGLFTQGFAIGDDSYGPLYRSDLERTSLTFAKSGSHLDGHWRYQSKDYPSGLVYEDVRFHRNGYYSLTFRYDSGRARHLSGQYRVGDHGALTFKAYGRVALRGTLSEPTNGAGKARPGKLGIWLILSGRQGKHGDGNLLGPKR